MELCGAHEISPQVRTTAPLHVSCLAEHKTGQCHAGKGFFNSGRTCCQLVLQMCLSPSHVGVGVQEQLTFSRTNILDNEVLERNR